MSSLAEIFAPLIPALITGGLILGFRTGVNVKAGKDIVSEIN